MYSRTMLTPRELSMFMDATIVSSSQPRPEMPKSCIRVSVSWSNLLRLANSTLSQYHDPSAEMRDFFRSCYELFLYMTAIGSMLDSGKLRHPGLDKFQHVLSPDLDIPSFSPSGGLQHPFVAGDPNFKCEYPKLAGWTTCNSATNRSCWLQPPKNSKVPLAPFDINTDYEAIFPEGKVREYNLTVENVHLDPDGFIKTKGKAFARVGEKPEYPGPLIEVSGLSLVMHRH